MSTVWDLWDNIKNPNILFVGVPEGGKEQGAENILEIIIAGNIPNLGKGNSCQVQEVQNSIEDQAKEPSPRTFSRIDHILSHKSSLGKFKKIEIIPSIFSDHNAVRLDVKYRKKLLKIQTYGG